MTVTLIFTFAGIVLIGVLGFVGRRKPAPDLSEWAVGGRKFGSITMWFLQAGEVFTTFTFLGMAGLAFSGGVAAMYALPYIPIGYMVLFFLAKRLWSLGKERGYLTQGDFLTDRFGSPALGALSAVLGVLFVLPYLQLQITGLGLIVKLVTGNAVSSTLSMVVGCALVVAFVLWAGLRGVATTSYFKDVVMLIVLVVLLVAVPTHFAGGVSGVFHRIEQLHPQALTVHAGTNDHTWFITSMVVSAIGVALMCLPHTWPALMSARNPKVLRRNYTWMPIYELCLLLPMIIGFAAILVVPKGTDSNGVLLSLSKGVLPSWATGLVVVAAIATAMVPAAGILIGISSLVARNIVRVRGQRTQFWVNHGTVVLACGLALLLGIFRPDLLANMLLLTFSGSVQLAPANVIGFTRRVPVGKVPVLAGLIVGEIVVIWLTFIDKHLAGHVNVGLVGLAANVVVLLAGALIERAVARTPEREAEAVRA
ncbi:sodium:solute symporter family protein [Amycolatopsis alkalitolerans]|uniref:Sodium:solute symporter family protein n=1 Tax=Amycolatopsis alkalitolerans TaxID=2547244 RepID=A0A5C4M7U3_9PSEU|nr:sodium:solute symporter family protein [Amycolatopsis alkalitolerans]TNC29045.1 sodium:solute symporter family protein [Amycolatopsis alkalitolerans]